MNQLFAQNNSSSSEKNDTTKVVLCSNAKGEQGFLINNGNGHTEFQSVDQFVKSRSNVQSNNNLSGTVSKKTVTGVASSAQAKGREAVVGGQSTGRDSSALGRPDKLPPVLSEGPPSRH